jgi:two-component system, NarL family, sensor kinase
VVADDYLWRSLQHERTRGVLQFEGVPSSSRSSSHDLRVLKSIAEALNGAADVGEALQITLEQVAALLGLDAGWIWLTDPQSGRFYGAIAQHLPPFLREPVRMSGQSCWCLRAFRAGELTAGNIDVMECSRLRAAVQPADRARTHGLRYHASIPLYFGERPLGVMNVAAPAWRKLTRRELDLLSTIASQVGVAIERARLAGESIHVARMEERTRLARQIHDTLAQGLTAIGLQIEAAIDSLPKNAGARPPLQRALELSSSALEDARGSIRELRSAGALPLPEALGALAHDFAADTGIRVHLRATDRVALPAWQEEEIVRIATEALTNVRKHAQATDVEISLTSTRRQVRLTITDNGSGFNPRARSRGFGVIGMRERAETLGGRLAIGARKGGVHLSLVVPLGSMPRNAKNAKIAKN